MNTPNREYWLTRDGALYADQQKVRRASGNDSYEKQEAWLLGFLSHQSSQLGRPVRVLDFGAGFGRMARALAPHTFVDYYGFDISAAMAEPLLRDPPPEIASSLHERVRIGMDVAEAMGSQTFDVIFTVSVLIHNNPEQAGSVISSMRKVLAPQGVICLIENRPVSISMLANQWHAGCWSHDVVGTLAADMDVDVEDGILADHGIYLLREPAQGAREVRVPGSAGFEPVDLGSYLLRTREATVGVVRALESELNTAPDVVASSRDAIELYRQAEARAKQCTETVLPLLSGAGVGAQGPLIWALDALPDLAKKYAAAESRVAELEHLDRAFSEATEKLVVRDAETAALRRQLETREIISSQLATIEVAQPHRRIPAGGHELPTLPIASWCFNAVRDTQFARQVAGHERVCHLMHQEWFGIRAAAGALPGHKLAVSSMREPTPGEVEQVAKLLHANGVERVVVHGWSNPMRLWTQALSRAASLSIYLVWHGAPAMWVHDEERRLFEMAVAAAKRGVLKRIHVMRPGGNALLGRHGWGRQLYNMPPAYERRRPAKAKDKVIAFSPSWNLLHKNLHTNIAAALCADAVDEVWTLTPNLELPYATAKKVRKIPKLDQLQMMETMELCNVVLNASIVDCHPMVELEALAAGTPAVRGRLGLDSLEEHAYVALTQVNDPLSVVDVSSTISRVLEVGASEMDEMMDSYTHQLVELSSSRYLEMLEL